MSDSKGQMPKIQVDMKLDGKGAWSAWVRETRDCWIICETQRGEEKVLAKLPKKLTGNSKVNAQRIAAAVRLERESASRATMLEIECAKLREARAHLQEELREVTQDRDSVCREYHQTCKEYNRSKEKMLTAMTAILEVAADIQDK